MAWTETHEITMTSTGRKVLVMDNKDGGLQTHLEWLNGCESSWTYDEDGNLQFAGNPNTNATIERISK
jgi:hypothetical protein